MAELNYGTHTCGALRAADAGRSVRLQGWVHRVRDLGGVIFFDLRDRYGMTQGVVRAGSGVSDVANRVRPEFVVAVDGIVEARTPEAMNPRMTTGEIEVAAAGVGRAKETRA